MKKEDKEKEQEAALLLLEAFREQILKENTNDERYKRILDMLTKSIKDISADKKIPMDEVNVVYNHVCKLCFVDKIKLNAEEGEALNKLKEFGESKGVLDSIRRANFSAAGIWMGK